MEPKIIWVLLAAHLVQGSTIPVGLSSENWDKEYDLRTLGQFKVKFNDVTDITKGCRLYVELNVPNKMSLYTLGVTNIQLDFTFKGLLDAKMSYKMTVNNALVEGQVNIVKALDGHAAVVVNGKEYVLQDFKFETDKSTKIAVEMTVAGKVSGMKLIRITPDTISLDYYMDGVTVYNFVLENKLKTNLLDIKCNGRNIFNLNIEKFFDGTNIFTNTLTIQNIPKITFIIVKKWTGSSLFIHHKLEANNQLLYSTEHAMTASTNFRDQVRLQNNEKCFIPVTSPLYSILAGLFMTKTDFNLHRNVLIDINLGQGGRIVYKDTVHVGDDLHMHLGFDNAVTPYNFKIKLPVGLKVLRSFLGVTPKALGDNCCCDLEIGFKMGKKVTVKPSCMENTMNAEWSGLGGSPVFSVSSVSGQSVDVLAEVEHNSPLSTYYIRINNQLELTIRHEVGKEIGIKSNLFIPQDIKVSFAGTEYAIEYMDYKLLALDLRLGEHLAILTLPLVPKTRITITWDEKDILKNRVEANLELAGIRYVLDISTAWSVKEQSYEIVLRSSIPLFDPVPMIDMNRRGRINKQLEEIEKLLGQLLFFKKYGTIAGQAWALEDHWIGDSPLKSYEKLVPEVAIETLINAGKELTIVMNSVTTVLMKPLEDSINELIHWVGRLSQEEQKKMEESMELVSGVQKQFSLTRNEMVTMAKDTINRVNDIIEEILKIGPDSTEVGKQVELVMKNFQELLMASINSLEDAKNDYKRISKDLLHVKAYLVSFSQEILKIVRDRENNMNAWIKKTRGQVYGGCAASAIFPPLLPVCYGTAAGILETKIKNRKAENEHMKNMARDYSIRAKEMEAEVEKNTVYITSEMILLNRWKTQVNFNIDALRPLFGGDFDFFEFLNDIQGKPETMKMLCDLSSICKIFIKQNLKETDDGWERKSKIWSDAQCPNIKMIEGHPTLQHCKENCLETPTCTAFNFNLKGGCVLRGCSFPAPEPQWSFTGFNGYRLSALKKLTPIDAKMPDVFTQGGRLLSARNCIDGEITDNYAGSGLCHTGVPHTCPWIAIDLGSSMAVSKVVIYNRKDCCGDRTKNVHIFVSSEVPTDASKMTNKGQLLGKFPGPGSNGEIIEVSSADALQGRFVIVQMDLGQKDYLNLGEVEVYGPRKQGSAIPARHPQCDIMPMSMSRSIAIPCEISTPKEQHPSSIDTLQPGNIEILGSIGDSLSAATGYEGSNPEVLRENKLVSFVSGAHPDKFLHSSLYNILLDYSPNIRGGSTGANDPGDQGPAAGFNFATAGATLKDSMAQAEKLVKEIRRIDGSEQRWKVITFQFGIADLCSAGAFGGEWAAQIAATLDTLENLPKTVVLLLAPMDVNSFQRPGCSKPLPKAYDWMNKDAKCRNEISENSKLLEYYLYDLADRFRTETFGVEVLPALKNYQVDTAKSDDCLHPSEEDHSMIGKNVWNNFLTPAEDRTSDYSYALHIQCPDPDAYIPLTKPGSKTQPFKTMPKLSAQETELIIENVEPSKGNVYIEFQSHGRVICTTQELNTGKHLLSRKGVQTYAYTFIEDCYFTKDDQIEFRVKAEKSGSQFNDGFCLKNLKITLPKMTLTSSTKACAEGEWQPLKRNLQPCGVPF